MRRAHCAAESQCMSVRLPALKKTGPSPLPIKLYRCARDILKAAQNSGTVKATLSMWALLRSSVNLEQHHCRDVYRNYFFQHALLPIERRVSAARYRELIGMG